MTWFAMLMNIARLTGWTPRVVMWEIPFPTLMRMISSLERPEETTPGTLGESRAFSPISPEQSLAGALSMGLFVEDKR